MIAGSWPQSMAVPRLAGQAQLVGESIALMPHAFAGSTHTRFPSQFGQEQQAQDQRQAGAVALGMPGIREGLQGLRKRSHCDRVSYLSLIGCDGPWGRVPAAFSW